MSLMRSYLVLILIFFSLGAKAKIDDSVSIFFPKKLKSLELTQTQFSFFWWNFIVIEPDDGKFNFTLSEKVCTELFQKHSSQISNLICGSHFEMGLGQLKDWALDLPLRQTINLQSGPALLAKANQTLTQASVISDPALISLLRADPFGEWPVYLDRLQKLAANAFQMNRGFLTDETSKRIVIPIQFNVLPKKANVEEVMTFLNAQPGLHVIGAHASSFANEKQVQDDMQTVSVVGIFSLIAFAAFLILKGRKNIIFLYIPVFVSVGIATYLTEVIYGSIHGLTLAFGSGIVGLVLDYGLHGAFNIQSTQTWKSNSVGLFTTLVGLGCLVFCSIPLIQQMMVFAILGLGIGYAAFYVLCKRYSKYFGIEGLLYPIPHFRSLAVVTLALSLLSLFSLARIDWSLDLKSMNFQSESEFKAAQWLYQKNDSGEALFAIHTIKPVDQLETELTQEYDFANQEKLTYEGYPKYLPDQKQQAANRQSWQSHFCGDFYGRWSPDQEKFFKPFWEKNCKLDFAPASFQSISYLKHITSEESAMSVFFAKNGSEKAKIQKAFPRFESLKDNLIEFSAIFEHDLRIIIPVAFLLCSFLLFIYYRRWLFVLSAAIPFFCGTGLFLFYKMLMHQQIDLMGLVGLIMVYCFSLDYGIFATDIVVFPQSQHYTTEVRTSLTFAGLSNLLGYFPLIFAKHTVLHNLGLALFLGTLGTYLGTMWGTPVVAAWGKSSR